MKADLRLDGKGTLVAQIKRAIAAPIIAGKFAPDSRIPSEHELMALFNASRMTVHRAISALAEEGLIVRRRRLGSFVARRSREHAVLDISDVAAEVEAAGAVYRYELRLREEIDADAYGGPSPDAEAGARLLRLDCLHYADDEPFVLEQRTINLAAAPQARAADFNITPPGRWLLHHVPWSEAEHVIKALNADRSTAAALGIAPGAACLAMERRTWRMQTPVTVVTLTYPGDRHRMTARFMASPSMPRKPEGQD